MAEGRMLKRRKSIPIKIKTEVIKKCGANPKCFYCGKKGSVSSRYGKPVVIEKEPYKKWINEYDGTYILSHRAMEFDHVIPISGDGKNIVENIVISCRFCNRSKGRKINGQTRKT